MELQFSRHIFEKYSNIKFHENPSSGSRDFPCGETDGQTDMTKLRVAFRNYASAPIKAYKHVSCKHCTVFNFCVSMHHYIWVY